MDVNSPASVQATFQAITKELPDAHLGRSRLQRRRRPLREALPRPPARGPRRQPPGQTRTGLLNFAHAILPLLLGSVDAGPVHPPSLIVTGATASLRGSARFADFAAGKFAARALTQSLAREFGPRGVHVAHAIIDGAIDVPKLVEFKEQITGGKPDAMLSPDSIAESYFCLHTQHRSAFTQELDLRPYTEKF
ncbi:unnamed protein product [Discula destructiva]